MLSQNNKVQIVEAYQLSMLVLPLLHLPRIWEPKTSPAPKMQAPARTGMATAITRHFCPGPRWSPELGRREPALLSLQIQKTQLQLPASHSCSLHGLAENRLNEDQSNVRQQTEDCCHACQMLSPEYAVQIGSIEAWKRHQPVFRAGNRGLPMAPTIIR